MTGLAGVGVVAADRLLDLLGATARDYADLPDRGWIENAALQAPSPIFPRLDMPAAEPS